jgi:erythromycin esterase
MRRALAIAPIVPLLLVLALPALAQPPAPSDSRVDWLRANAVRIRSISPEDRDFSDLQPLKKILGDSRVVLLGEQSHGDGSVFLAKTRLIQFLHEEMGFDVLAFESGLFDCRRAWEALQAGEDPVAAVRRGVFGIWTRSEQVIPLMEYLGRRVRTQRPLELVGFDNQFTASASRDFVVADLADYLRRIGSPAPEAPDWKVFAGTLRSLAEAAYLQGMLPVPSAAEQERFRAQLRDLREEIGRRSAPRPDWDALFWQQMMDSIGAYTHSEWVGADLTESTDEGRQARDEQMGRNLIWLANERYPGRKIIVWAATFHNARNLRKLDPGLGNPEIKKVYEDFAAMGEVAHRTLGDKMYSLGFTAAAGRAGSAFGTPQNLSRPSPGSLEDLMEGAGLENALVDFRNPPRGGHWLREPLISRPLGYTEMKGNWSEVLDGMMFIREMTPSTRAEQ